MTEQNKIIWEPIPEYGDHMTVEEFRISIECGLFIDWDGHGYYATATEMSNVVVSPSTFAETHKPEYTHVVWFNK